MARIALDHVNKFYGGGVKALDDLNLEVRDGEFMVLVGPSGCGRKVILGICPSDFEDGAFAHAALVGGKPLWTARVSSRFAVHPGTPLELAVDTSRLRFFAPASGECIGHVLAVGVTPSVARAERTVHPLRLLTASGRQPTAKRPLERTAAPRTMHNGR
jgi:energy-coupling factor transporter ATP-binding protein EcfA2